MVTTRSGLMSRRHIRIGWYSLLCFLSLGIFLEAMHGFKVELYVDLSNETRRTMWTLAHAHGTLLSLVHIVFAFTVTRFPGRRERWHRVVSPCLTGASVLMPLGFFLGGLYTYGGDPGLGIILLPIGAILLFVAVLTTARCADDGASEDS